MEVLSSLPRHDGSWLSVESDGLPPMELRVLAAGSVRLSDGSWKRVVEKAYWLRYEEEDEPQWYVHGPDSYRLSQVTHFMALPELPERGERDRYTHQYTVADCPGRPCSSECDHRGVPPVTAIDLSHRFLIVSESERGFWSNDLGWVYDKRSATTWPTQEVGPLPITREDDAEVVAWPDRADFKE